METKAYSPKTLLEAITYFADVEVANDFMVRLRWPNGVICPHCESKEVTQLQQLTRKQSRRIWKCKNKECRKQFGVKVGTVMEDSPIGLDKWLPAFWLLTGAKNGISSCELARALGITQKSAWFVLHRIRLVLQQGSLEKMIGSVEADETYIGGLERNKHASKKNPYARGSVGKTIVMGILERGNDQTTSKAKAKVVSDNGGPVIKGEVRNNVAKGSALYTDSSGCYRGLNKEYTHEFVDHSIQYVAGQVHTNGLENYFSLLKRTIKGTYVAIAPCHLKRYLDEQTFRFNNRADTDSGRFELALSGAAGKRLTYAELISSYERHYDEVFPRY